MKAKFSPLKLKEFELLKSNYQFNIPKKEEIDIDRLFNSYTVQINFNHFDIDDNNIQVFVMITVNNLKKPKDGYTLVNEAVGVFQLIKKDLSDAVFNNLKFYSTLNMMINNLRNIMFQTTNIGPLGGYYLPAIDIVDLFDKKSKKVAK
jgi:preprotein translocase subunit SecB